MKSLAVKPACRLGATPGGVPGVLVLGPVAVRDAAGAEVGLGGARPRRLLAGLAIHAGEPVPADRLADIVWGEQPPRSARANLHTYLWSLRRCLADAGGRAVIDAGPGGYVLCTGPGALDWHLFRDLAAAAAGIAGSDPAAAAGLLRQGLGLWRGPAAADLDGGPPAVVARIAAMDEARLGALEQRIEADLAAGHHRDLAPELAELTAAHPLREQFRAAQMTALYRSGRQADALTAFHQLRHHLAAELGIDPSLSLRALHEAILRNDPLVWPATPAGGGPPDRLGPGRPTVRAAGNRAPLAVPARADQPAAQVEVPGGMTSPQRRALNAAGRAGPPGTAAPDMPPGITLGQRAATEEARLFQGRRAELARLLGLLAAPARLPRVVQVHGPAGIGKTAFAHALARECAARGWRAVILDSRDFAHDGAALAETVTARCAGAWSPGCSLPLLLVLDTVEEMRDMEHQLWDGLLPRITGPVLVVLSGRRPTPVFARPTQWGDLVDELELRGLTEAESRRLVRLHGVRAAETIGEILAFGRGNPLFLSVAAQHARSAGTGSLESSGPMARSLIGRMTREIADPDVRKLLDAASLVRTFNQELLTAMLGRDVPGTFDALCGLSMVRAVPAGLRLHDLVRDSVAADFDWRAPQACQAMRQRAYLYLARRAQSATDAGPYIQELLHLAGSAARARFYAPADHPDVHVRPLSPEDLPRLTELCHTGISRFGLPAAERIRQLHTDLPVASRSFAVALNDAGAITGFAYIVRLNRDTWRTAAKTREAFFATLPESERAAITTAPPTALRAAMVTGATHLAGYDHVSAALRQALFPRARGRGTLTARFVAYHLLTPDSLELPEIIAAGHSRRTRDINLGGYSVDEWLLRFGEGGLLGWIGEVVGVRPSRTARG